MRTIRCSGRLSEGGSAQGGVSAQGGGECLPRGVVSAGEVYTTLPCEQNDLQRGVKT